MKNYFENLKEITSTKLIILISVFLIAFGNMALFSNIIVVYDVDIKNIAFLTSLVVVFSSANILLFSLVCFKYTIKPFLISILVLSSLAAYFMDSYNVIIDDTMIQNIVNTDIAESSDLITFKLIIYVTLLGVIPSIFVYKVNIISAGAWKEAVSRIKLFSFSLVVVIAIIIIFGKFYTSFFTEHKPLRYYANPTTYIYSATKYINRFIKRDDLPLLEIGLDAKVPSTDTHRELVIMVVGEAARADRFSLNGYKRDTNPLLKKEELVSFSNYWACGTTTAISVPCMFSIYPKSEYSDEKARASENILDVLEHAGVNVLWLDNNSDSKGVALRAPYESYRSAERNTVCDLECRDEGMLSSIQKYIKEHESGDIFIVLHQLGNHGPAYYKRYTQEFEKFTPACKTNQLENCSKEEIDNSYDNAILYTDYFLSKVIKLLKGNDGEFETVMFYISDHGESLGENGLYLHGMPDFIAPEEQRHVPGIIWLGSNYDEIDIKTLSMKKNNKYSHDNIFHTILGFMELETTIYNKELDIIHSDK